jgi:hypothetical protein
MYHTVTPYVKALFYPEFRGLTIKINRLIEDFRQISELTPSSKISWWCP